MRKGVIEDILSDATSDISEQDESINQNVENPNMTFTNPSQVDKS